MTLLLTLERAPQPQAVRQMRLETGELVIGRSADVDWQIDDKDLFISRAHCTISGRPGAYMVTDTSTGGLFVDDSRSPLGSGNSTPLSDGMRLRLGDYVVRVEMRSTVAAMPQAAPYAASPPQQYSPPPQQYSPPPHAPPPRAAEPPASSGRSPFGEDDFFSRPAMVTPPQPRPAGLPDPFEKPVAGAWSAAAPQRPQSAAFDDPFSLDPLPSQQPSPVAQPAGFGDFDLPSVPPTPAPSAPPASSANAWPATAPAAAADPFAWQAPEPQRPPSPPVLQPPQPPPAAPVQVAHAPVTPPQPQPQPTPPVGDQALLAAFVKGLGVEPNGPSRDPLAEMEAFGREYRLMMEGLMHLLRKRAEEKSNARIAQTTIGSLEVNPLKFLPNAEAALATFLSGKAPGFLPAEAAIAGAIRDLAHHHVSAWRGVQGALSRMLDRFDPAALEAELKTLSAFETLLAGGKRAKLWELYEQRYREIAKSAEQRFLGEVGADFRDAYEDKGE